MMCTAVAEKEALIVAKLIEALTSQDGACVAAVARDEVHLQIARDQVR